MSKASTDMPSVAFTATQQAGRLAMHRSRKRRNVVALTLSLGAMAFGLFWLVWILFETVRLGLGYNFSSFSDEEFARLSEDHGGPFFRVIAHY